MQAVSAEEVLQEPQESYLASPERHTQPQDFNTQFQGLYLIWDNLVEITWELSLAEEFNRELSLAEEFNRDLSLAVEFNRVSSSAVDIKMELPTTTLLLLLALQVRASRTEHTVRPGCHKRISSQTCTQTCRTTTGV